jgi:hypothetical protein
VVFRNLLSSLRQIGLYSVLCTSVASAQTQLRSNIFFGFDYVLNPIAIKWACGGDPAQDMSQIAVLTAAFPKDAEQAGLQKLVDSLLETSRRNTGVLEILDAKLSDEQVTKLCSAALPLRIDWATPEQLVSGASDTVGNEQIAAWNAFYKAVEDVQ